MKTLTCLVFLRFYLSYKWHVKRNCGSSASVRMSVSNEVLLSQPVTIRPRKIKCRKRVKFSDSVTTEKMVVNNVSLSVATRPVKSLSGPETQGATERRLPLKKPHKSRKDPHITSRSKPSSFTLQTRKKRTHYFKHCGRGTPP